MKCITGPAGIRSAPSGGEWLLAVRARRSSRLGDDPVPALGIVAALVAPRRAKARQDGCDLFAAQATHEELLLVVVALT